MATRTQFKLAVTALSLEEPEYQPCSELLEIWHAPRIATAHKIAAELYHQASRFVPFPRTIRKCFLAIDIEGDPTDQMGMVGIIIRCPNAVLPTRINALLCQIRERSEIKNSWTLLPTR